MGGQHVAGALLLPCCRRAAHRAHALPRSLHTHSCKPGKHMLTGTPLASKCMRVLHSVDAHVKARSAHKVPRSTHSASWLRVFGFRPACVCPLCTTPDVQQHSTVRAMQRRAAVCPRNICADRQGLACRRPAAWWRGCWQSQPPRGRAAPVRSRSMWHVVAPCQMARSRQLRPSCVSWARRV